MALTFLELTNDVLTRLNETPLTSTNFPTALGVYSDAKNYVNSSINRINREQFEWEFNHVTQDLTLVVGQSKYSFPADAKLVAFDSFVIKGNDALNVESQKLIVLDYEEYLEKYSDHEFRPTEYLDLPAYVVKRRDRSFTVTPPPDKAYVLRYEYYRLTSDLVDWDDETTIPDFMRWIILEGAMHQAYMFRGDLESAAMSDNMFRQGVKDLRVLSTNRYEYVRSGFKRG